MENGIPKELMEIAQKHTVDYEVWSHDKMAGDQNVMVGFDLELHGTHDHGKTRLSPGCQVCMFRIEHRHDFDQPVDDCEKRCLADMQEKLAALGVRRHRHTRSR